MASSSVTLITTGGTIGSSIQSDSVNGSQGQQKLRSHVQELCQQHAITLTTQPAFNKNSEDLCPTDWLDLIQTIKNTLAAGTDKIVITHGTDTMAYTAAAVALCFKQHPVKIVLTGSCFPLDHPDSDVTKNLLGALRCITEPKVSHGVYLSWTNQAGKTEVMDALDIKPMVFDELGFKACFNQLIGTFKTPGSQFETSTRHRCTQPLTLSLAHTNLDNKAIKNSKVHQFICYPGMQLRQFCATLAAGSCVIISLYHSGTAPSQNANEAVLAAMASFPELTFLLTPLPSLYVSTPYASTVSLIQAGAILYEDLQPHVLYVILVLGLASGLAITDILAQLESHQRLCTTD